MKKKLVSLILVLALAVTAMAVPAFADYNSSKMPYNLTATTYDMEFDGNSGHHYKVNYSTWVGYNHTETGDAVKVCQAFINAVLLKYSALHSTSVTVIAVDGIWGNKSETALRKAQYYAGTSDDGICGNGTWVAMRTYVGGITSTVKSYL